MDPDSDEDLFKFTSSQDTLGDGLDYVSDDDVILNDEHDLAASRTLRDSSLPTAIHTDNSPDAMLLEDIEDAGSIQTASPKASVLAHARRDRQWVIVRVEQMIDRILDALLGDVEELTIILKTRSGLSRRDAHEKQGKAFLPAAKTVEITFPGATAHEAWRFSVILRILEFIHNCLVENIVLSKRDLYYRDTELFVKQSVVDRYVDDLACTFNVPRSALNITAAAKGLVAGNFIIMRAHGSKVDGLSETEGLLVPRIQDDDDLDVSLVHHIIVIEKEATFRSLLSSPAWGRLKSQCLVITAKGYPDLASRKFLRRIADHAPCIPMHILVDFDPDGVNIMSTYKYGSFRLAHEDGSDNGSPAINLPQLRWLGVQSYQLSRIPAMGRISSDSTTSDDYGIIRMTARDRRKACRMLEWDIVTEKGVESGWMGELQVMLMLNIKAEMQVLEERPGGLASWLIEELQQYECTFESGRPGAQTGETGSDEVLDLL